MTAISHLQENGAGHRRAAPIAAEPVVLFHLVKKMACPLPQVRKQGVEVLPGAGIVCGLAVQPGQEFAFHGDMIRRFLDVAMPYFR